MRRQRPTRTPPHSESSLWAARGRALDHRRQLPARPHLDCAKPALGRTKPLSGARESPPDLPAADDSSAAEPRAGASQFRANADRPTDRKAEALEPPRVVLLSQCDAGLALRRRRA
jgi:hypothetical protein